VAFFAAAVAANSRTQNDATGHAGPDLGSVVGSDVLADYRPEGCSLIAANCVRLVDVGDDLSGFAWWWVLLGVLGLAVLPRIGVDLLSNRP